MHSIYGIYTYTRIELNIDGLVLGLNAVWLWERQLNGDKGNVYDSIPYSILTFISCS